MNTLRASTESTSAFESAPPTVSGEQLRALFPGLDFQVPLLGGGTRPYVNLDNAATTPPFQGVLDRVNDSARWYSSVHRGTGLKSRISTRAFDAARSRILRFLGADPGYHVPVFCANATDAINRLANRFPLQSGELVLSTVLEHHANLLPWRFRGQVDHVEAKWPCGMLDFADLERKLEQHAGRVRLLAVTAASNITGLVLPLGRLARAAHRHGAQILVDASQLVAHRPLVLDVPDPAERIDFLVFSGHKMYAPFGSGCLVGPRAFFEQGTPGILGGGAVDFVSLDQVEWTGVPEREEAGTPNLFGVLAIAKAMDVLESVGMDRIAQHEQEMANRAIERLGCIPGITLFGGCERVNRVDHLPVIPLHCERIPHALLAAILAAEWGIGVRNGCFCAHPYVEHLLQVDPQASGQMLERIRRGDRTDLPGFVRVSLGLFNTLDEIEYLAAALESILANGPRGNYLLDGKTGEYHPEGFPCDLDVLAARS